MAAPKLPLKIKRHGLPGAIIANRGQPTSFVFNVSKRLESPGCDVLIVAKGQNDTE